MNNTIKDVIKSEIGKLSSAITDMAIKGASKEELTKAIKHSMTVIDAVKHAEDKEDDLK